jgi:hypothetical protein
MKRFVSLGHRRFVIEIESGGGATSGFTDGALARRLVAEGGNRAAIRAILAEDLRIGALARLDDDQVAAELARQLASGRMLLREARLPPLFAVDGDAPSEPPAPISTRQARTEVTWIEICLIGEDRKPIPGERYKIELPDGSTREGRLDDKGLARVDGIDPGSCTVSFPALDEEAWVRA